MELINLNKTKKYQLKLDKKGKYLIYFFNLSENISITIQKPEIEVEILGLFIGRKNKKFNLQTKQIHKSEKSKSNLFIKGVFFDESQFNYSSLIKIEKKAKKTEAHQKNQNIVLGKNAKIETSPFLEISQNDVICSHGSSTGKLPSNQIQYLKTRGLTPKKAELLLIQGFVDEIFAYMIKSQIDVKIVQQYRNQALKYLE